MYTKLFQSIVTSTIWTEDDKTRLVWITMLALSDQHGEVAGSIPGLARLASVSIEDCESALEKLKSPDPYSRTTDYEGRRIQEIEGGWVLLNHDKYRRMASKDDRKEKAAARQRRCRERKKVSGASHAPVTRSHAFDGECHAMSRASHAPVTQHADIAEAEAKAEAVLVKNTTREAFEEMDSETLAKQGKSLESISARLAIPVENLLAHGETAGIKADGVKAWADSRVANGWKTSKGTPLTPVTWPADLNSFANAFRQIEQKKTHAKTSNGHDRNVGTANEGRAAAYANIGRRRA